MKLETAFSSINTYLNGFKYGSRLRIRRIINDKFFSEQICKHILSVLKTRQKFVKKLYSDYIIIFRKKDYNYIYDYEFLNLFKDKISIINKLNKYYINYIIINNMKIINKKVFPNNKYNYYKKIYIIYKILNRDNKGEKINYFN